MLKKALGALALAVVVAVPAAAQTADEIIAKSQEAQGGLAKLKAVQSVRMTGKMTVGPGIEAPGGPRDEAPQVDAPRHLHPGDDDHAGLRRHRRAGCSTRCRAGPRPKPLPSEMTKLVEEQADMDGPLDGLQGQGHTVELLGQGEGRGHRLLQAQADAEERRRPHVLLRRRVVPAREAGVEDARCAAPSSSSDTIVGDYKEVGGMMMAALDGLRPGRPARCGRR